jgi:polyhydroxyalkanoate synthesis regulator phasin
MATRSGGSGSNPRSTGVAQGRGGGKRTSRATGARARSDKSVEAFRNALERSVTLSRDRLQEAVDEAVERGRMTRGDANELVSKLVSRGRQQTNELLRDLERLLEQARGGVDSRTEPARRQATRTAGRAARAARDAADPALAGADKLRRRAGVRAASPITAYDQLTVSQVRTRLKDLDPAELRKVRTHEQRGKARKGVLEEIDRRLAKG